MSATISQSNWQGYSHQQRLQTREERQRRAGRRQERWLRGQTCQLKCSGEPGGRERTNGCQIMRLRSGVCVRYLSESFEKKGGVSLVGNLWKAVHVWDKCVSSVDQVGIARNDSLRFVSFSCTMTLYKQLHLQGRDLGRWRLEVYWRWW